MCAVAAQSGSRFFLSTSQENARKVKGRSKHAIAKTPSAIHEPRLAVSRSESPPLSGGNALREYLREWRRNEAKEQGMPAFIVLHDTSLDALCRIRPRNLADFRRVTGFGDKKIELYGAKILKALSEFQKGPRGTSAPS
jgi:superfamily II DNA helicase RecQ